MNMFKTLDSLFPCGADRLCGEVVSVSIQFLGLKGPTAFSDRDAFISWKRKAWYVNASVNAFHMHRGLVGEASSVMDLHGLSRATRKEVNGLIAIAVARAYCENSCSGKQYSEMVIDVNEWPQPALIIFSEDEPDGVEGPVEYYDRDLDSAAKQVAATIEYYSGRKSA